MADMDIRKAAMNFEAVKVKMLQTKDGILMTMAIHPNDVPPSLMTSWVGTRYMVAVVQIGDDEQPVVPKEKLEGERMVQSAAMLCRNDRVQDYLLAEMEISEPTEEAVATWMRKKLSLKSRSELATNLPAQERFLALRSSILASIRDQSVGM